MGHIIDDVEHGTRTALVSTSPSGNCLGRPAWAAASRSTGSIPAMT